MRIQAPKGTRDLLPSDLPQWQFVERTVRELFERFGYREIRTPIFEHTELFVRGVGDTTDIVEKEMYTFTDKGGRRISLRPEGTASVVRACLQNHLFDTLPVLKLYYLGQMFRYERPQAGRYREFWQAGIEAFGSSDPALDAEVIALAYHLLEYLGLSGVQIRLNSIGDQVCRPDYTQQLLAFIKGHLDELCGQCHARYERNPLRVLDCKQPRCRAVMADAPKMLDHLCDDCEQHLQQVKGFLDDLGVAYELDPTIVRGLDYYTRTAFAVVASGLGAQDEVLGGGRYDTLVEQLGGKPTPGVGFAFGLDRLILALQAQKVAIPLTPAYDAYLAVMGEEAAHTAIRLAYELRQQGLKTEMEFARRSLRAQMKTADKLQARFVLLLGENELAQGIVTVRDMKDGQQWPVAHEELGEFLLRKRIS